MGWLDKLKPGHVQQQAPVPSAAPPPSTVVVRTQDWESRTRQRTEIQSVTLAVALALPAFVLLLLCSLGLSGINYLAGEKGELNLLPIGYAMDANTAPFGIATMFVNSASVNAGLLTSMVIIPISAAFTGFAVVLGIVGHVRALAGVKTASAALGFISLSLLLVLCGFIIGMLVFSPSRTYAGSHPSCHYGIANWLSLAALVLLCVGRTADPEARSFFARGFFKGALELERIRRATELQPGPMLLMQPSGPPSGWSAGTGDTLRKTHYVDDVDRVTVLEDQRGPARRQTVFERFSRAWDRR